MSRLLLLAAACLFAVDGLAHDLINAESAQAWLVELNELQSQQHSSADAVRKGEAAYRIGVVLETIRELLNQDLQSHGEVSGLSSQYLVAALKERGLAFDYSAPRRQFMSRPGYFREALRLAPAASFAADAGFRLLDAMYQDKLGHDPLGAALAPAASAEMIALAEQLDTAYPAHARREEIEFIAAILYTRAARDCRKSAAAVGSLKKARQSIAEFERRYPASLRAAAMPVLLDALAHC